MNPLRRLTVESPLETTPRPSSVNRQARESANSAPIVALNPALISSKASSTNVPLMALPLPLRRCTLAPKPTYVVIPGPCGITYCRSRSAVRSLQKTRPMLTVKFESGSFTSARIRSSNRLRASLLNSDRKYERPSKRRKRGAMKP